MEYQFRPLEAWPGERTRVRKRAQFRAKFSDTVDRLERELHKLGARNVVIQADCDPSEIRLDGMLRSGAKLRGPGVILSFDSKVGPLSYPCDRYLDYQDNLRAIALSLEALRAVDRYGVTRRAEQYRGWAKLPGPGPSANGHESLENAAAFIARNSVSYTREEVLSAADLFRDAYRQAAAKLHPDRNGGDDAAFKRLQAAREILEAHHG
jgi:hypothetical protein